MTAKKKKSLEIRVFYQRPVHEAVHKHSVS